MDNTTSLLQTRTFWAQALGLLSLIAYALNLPGVGGVIADPHTVDMVLLAITAGSQIAGMYFRKKADAKVVSVLPKPIDVGGPKLSIVLLALVLLPALAGCNSLAGFGAPKELSGAQLAAGVAAVEAQQAQKTPEEKAQQAYEIACQGVIVLQQAWIAYRPASVKPDVQQKEEAAFAAVQSLCQSRPTSYAGGLVALMKAVSAYQAQLQALKASTS